MGIYLLHAPLVKLLQETFYQAFLHIDRFEGRCSVYTWLCQIGKNTWLKECKRQKRFDGRAWEELEFADGNAPPEEDARTEKESIRKSFRKIRRRWAMSLLVIPLLLLLSGPGIMIANEVRGEGICFSNLDDIWKCHRFWKLMVDGKYEKAVEMLDFSDK